MKPKIIHGENFVYVVLDREVTKESTFVTSDKIAKFRGVARTTRWCPGDTPRTARGYGGGYFIPREHDVMRVVIPHRTICVVQVGRETQAKISAAAITAQAQGASYHDVFRHYGDAEDVDIIEVEGTYRLDSVAAARTYVNRFYEVVDRFRRHARREVEREYKLYYGGKVDGRDVTEREI